MGRVESAFDGCYEASRAAALAGVPASTVYHWARHEVVVPSVSRTKPKLWSYADLMALRIVYWLRHPKSGGEVNIPASPMHAVRKVLNELDSSGVDIWSSDDSGGHSSPLLVDRSGRIHVNYDGHMSVDRQGVMGDVLDLLGPFDTTDGDGMSGPDLRRPRPHLRIIPGRVSGEPHLEHSRLTTQAVVALADRGFNVNQIQRLYPGENAAGIREAIDLERRLAA